VGNLCVDKEKKGSTISFSEEIHKYLKVITNSDPADPIKVLNDLLIQLDSTDINNPMKVWDNKSMELDCAYMGPRSLVLVLLDGSILYHIIDSNQTYPYHYHSWKVVYPYPGDGEKAKWETISAEDINRLKEKYSDLGDDFIYAFAKYLAEPLPDQGTEDKPLPFRRNPMLELWFNKPVPESTE
ncbi:MAG: hypothetical protein K6C40_00865, partial [Thermoguttaceae bacterium]|nr:hypothetical protein [Thermoguttaceae bacterium]